MSQARLKKFTHEKIAEQLEKRRSIPQYEALLLKCKYSEDSVGVVLDTSCPAWKQLQLLVRDFEQKQAQAQAQAQTQPQAGLSTTGSPQSISDPKSADPGSNLDAQKLRSLSTHIPQNPDAVNQIEANSQPTTALSLLRTPSRPLPQTQLDKAPSSHSQSSTGHSSHHPQSTKQTPASPQQQKKTPSKLFLFPRVPTENVRQLCQELFIPKNGSSGSIFQGDFTPEKIASQTDPISPFTNLPSHLRLNPNISVHTVRKACLHNGIACIPNALRGLVWAILLDIDVSSLSAYSSPPQTPHSNITALQHLDRASSSSSSGHSPAPTNSQNQSNQSSSPRYAQPATPEQQRQLCEQFIAKNGVSSEPEDPTLPPINGYSVLKVDLHRTYPHLDIFSQPTTLNAMEKLLVRSCRLGSVDYKQGMNYLLATLMLVWMPVFSKYSIEDMHYPTSTAASKDAASGDKVSDKKSNNLNAGAPAPAPAGSPNDLMTSPSNLSAISAQSIGSANNQPILQHTTSDHEGNIKARSPNQQSQQPPSNIPISPSQQNAIHEKHMEYQLQREAEMHQQTKFHNVESILHLNSPLITTSLCQLLNKLLPNTYSDHDFGSLQCLFMFFRLLLQYHDPVLSYYLDFNDMPPEFWASPWFLTLHVTRTKDISIILLLWDHLFLYLRQDPMLHYFISLGLLIDRREYLLQQTDTTLPETLSKLSIQSPHQLHTLFLFALQLHAQTPPSASRLLHTISTKVIGSDGDELQMLKDMMTIEIGADESLNQALSTNRYTYKDTLQSLSSSYYTSLLNKDLSSTPTPSGLPGPAALQNPLLQASSLTYGNTASQPPTTFLFIDCRDQWSYHRGHLSTSISFPLQHLNDHNHRQQLLRTIAGFKAMHVCIIHDGLQQQAPQNYGSVTPLNWNPQSAQYNTFLQSNQVCTLTSLISFLIYEGVRYVSVVSNGWIQIHQTSLVLGVELVSHSEDKCPLCQNPQRYEALLRKGHGGNEHANNVSQLLGPQTTVIKNGQQTPTMNSSTLPSIQSSVSSYFFGNKANKKNVSVEESKFNLDIPGPTRQSSIDTHGSGPGGNMKTQGHFESSQSNFQQMTPNNQYSSQFEPRQGQQAGLLSSISKFFTAGQQAAVGQHGHSHGLESAHNFSKSHPVSTTSQLQHATQMSSNNDLFAISQNDDESEERLERNAYSQNQLNTSILFDKDAFLDDHFTPTNAQLTAAANGGEGPTVPTGTPIKLPTIIPLAQRQQQQQQQSQANHQQPQQYAKPPLNASTLILTPPSLLHAIMLSNLRNISNKGHSLRQSVQFSLQNLILTALDNFSPKFFPNSGYPLSGHEYNYTVRPEAGTVAGKGRNEHQSPTSQNSSNVSNLWITGRIKTSSIETNKYSANSSGLNRMGSSNQQSISNESGPNNLSGSQFASSSPTPQSQSQPQHNSQPSIGYLLQSQLSIIGLVRPLTYISDENTTSMLSLETDPNATQSANLNKSNSSQDSQPQLVFSHNIMTHCLTSVAKQFSHTFLLSVGCIELIPSIPAKWDAAANGIQPQSAINSLDIDWVPRPVTIPPALPTQHILIFIPIVSIATSQMILTSLDYLLFSKHVPPSQLQLVTFAATHEGHDMLQHGYRKLVGRLLQQQEAKKAMHGEDDITHDANGAEDKTNKSQIDPLLVISSSLCQEEPMNKQVPFIPNDASHFSLYHVEDEHNDIFPSIPQFFARYLTHSE